MPELEIILFWSVRQSIFMQHYQARGRQAKYILWLRHRQRNKKQRHFLLQAIACHWGEARDPHRTELMARVMCMSSRQPGMEVEWERRNPAEAYWAHRMAEETWYSYRALGPGCEREHWEPWPSLELRVSIDVGIQTPGLKMWCESSSSSEKVKAAHISGSPELALALGLNRTYMWTCQWIQLSATGRKSQEDWEMHHCNIL